VWQLINREIGKVQEDDYKLEFMIGNNIFSKPMEITELLNMNFTITMAELEK
jgi:hypothetical protein